MYTSLTHQPNPMSSIKGASILESREPEPTPETKPKVTKTSNFVPRKLTGFPPEPKKNKRTKTRWSKVQYDPSNHLRAKKTGLPEHMLQNLEALSGYDMSDVRVHRNSALPKQIGAYSYAQGTNIYLGPNRECDLGHELVHTFQFVSNQIPGTSQGQQLDRNKVSYLERMASDQMTQSKIIMPYFRANRAETPHLPMCKPKISPHQSTIKMYVEGPEVNKLNIIGENHQESGDYRIQEHNAIINLLPEEDREDAQVFTEEAFKAKPAGYPNDYYISGENSNLMVSQDIWIYWQGVETSRQLFEELIVEQGANFMEPRHREILKKINANIFETTNETENYYNVKNPYLACQTLVNDLTHTLQTHLDNRHVNLPPTRYYAEKTETKNTQADIEIMMSLTEKWHNFITRDTPLTVIISPVLEETIRKLFERTQVNMKRILKYNPQVRESEQLSDLSPYYKVAFARSYHMMLAGHYGAKECMRDGKTMIWKIGDRHVEDIQYLLDQRAIEDLYTNLQERKQLGVSYLIEKNPRLFTNAQIRTIIGKNDQRLSDIQFRVGHLGEADEEAMTFNKATEL